MAVSLSPWSRVRVAIEATPTRARVRPGEPCVAVVARRQGCRELSLKVVEYAGLQRRGQGFNGGRESAAWCSRQQFKRCAVVARLFTPEDFDPSKLTVRFEGSANDIKAKTVEDLLPRKYTLTHSDVTGELLLSIGPALNRQQLADWYTRLMRDEIVAEWRGSEQIFLHVHCHVSGGHVLLAPAALRNSIFEREMPLTARLQQSVVVVDFYVVGLTSNYALGGGTEDKVLEAIRHGDKELLAEYPELHASTVWVHFHSSDLEYNRADCWGPLFYAASPMRRVTGKLVPSCISVPFTPHTLIEVQNARAELCSVMSP